MGYCFYDLPIFDNVDFFISRYYKSASLVIKSSMYYSLIQFDIVNSILIRNSVSLYGCIFRRHSKLVIKFIPHYLMWLILNLEGTNFVEPE